MGLDNARGTFYVLEAIRPRLRVVAQRYPQAELMALQRSFFDQVWAGAA